MNKETTISYIWSAYNRCFNFFPEELEWGLSAIISNAYSSFIHSTINYWDSLLCESPLKVLFRNKKMPKNKGVCGLLFRVSLCALKCSQTKLYETTTYVCYPNIQKRVRLCLLWPQDKSSHTQAVIVSGCECWPGFLWARCYPLKYPCPLNTKICCLHIHLP